MGTSARRSLARPLALVPTSGITSDDDRRALLSAQCTVGGPVLLEGPDGQPDVVRAGVGREGVDAVQAGGLLGFRDLLRQRGGVDHGLLGRVDGRELVGNDVVLQGHLELRTDLLEEVGQVGVGYRARRGGGLDLEGLGCLEGVVELGLVDVVHDGVVEEFLDDVLGRVQQVLVVLVGEEHELPAPRGDRVGALEDAFGRHDQVLMQVRSTCAGPLEEGQRGFGLRGIVAVEPEELLAELLGLGRRRGLGRSSRAEGGHRSGCTVGVDLHAAVADLEVELLDEREQCEGVVAGRLVEVDTESREGLVEEPDRFGLGVVAGGGSDGGTEVAAESSHGLTPSVKPFSAHAGLRFAGRRHSIRMNVSNVLCSMLIKHSTFDIFNPESGGGA